MGLKSINKFIIILFLGLIGITNADCNDDVKEMWAIITKYNTIKVGPSSDPIQVYKLGNATKYNDNQCRVLCLTEAEPYECQWTQSDWGDSIIHI